MHSTIRRGNTMKKSNNGDTNMTVQLRRFEKKTFVTFFYASNRTMIRPRL